MELGTTHGPMAWGRIGGIDIGPEGRIAVLDELTHHVRFFDARGRLLATLGREGGGPAEVRTPLGVIMDGEGQAWIPDSRNARYVVYRLDGKPAAAWPRRLRYDKDWRAAFLHGGRLLEPTSIPSTFDPKFYVRGFVVGDPRQLERDTIRIPSFPLPSFRDPRRPERGGGVSFEPTVPFTPRLDAAPDRRGFIWLGYGDAYRIALIDLAGDTVRIIESAAPALVVLDSEADSALAALRDQFPGFRALLRRERLPDHHPYFVDLVAGDGGSVWVRRPVRHAESRFDVFDADGVYCGTVSIPVRLDDSHLVIRQGTLAGVAEDASGAQRVLVFGLPDPCASGGSQ